jgi:RimJ/RimL family protein N-acetyltransferase
MTPIFTTARLVVRPWNVDDAEAAYAIYGDWEVARWLGARPKAHASVDESRARLETIVARDDGPGLGFWAVTRAEDGQVVGTVILRRIEDTDDVEVGWHLMRRHWGSGYATEAAAGALRHGFEDVGLDAVHAVVYPGNDRSSAVCERLAMTLVGRSTAYYGAELQHYVLTGDEWCAACG